MVRIHPDPPGTRQDEGAVAQLGEHLLCKQGVVGSIPISSTRCTSRGSLRGEQIKTARPCADFSKKLGSVAQVVRAHP